MPDLPINSTTIAARRRWWFGVCKELGLGEEQQLDIAHGVIPESHPLKYRDGKLSRRALFEDNRCWTDASNRLIRLAKQPPAGITGKITSKQLSYIDGLGRALGWDEHGEESLIDRLNFYATRRILGDKNSKSVHPIQFLTSAQASDMIQGLLAMLKHEEKKGNRS